MVYYPVVEYVLGVLFGLAVLALAAPTVLIPRDVLRSIRNQFEEPAGNGYHQGVDYMPDGVNVSGRWRYFRMPLWPLVVLACARLVLLFARRPRARSPWPRGLCRRCGYDLRASKERCPECGTPLPKECEATA